VGRQVPDVAKDSLVLCDDQGKAEEKPFQNDFWVGENQLVNVEDWDRRRGALSRPVELDWSYIKNREGVMTRTRDEWIALLAEAFRLKGYRRIEGDARPPQEPGEFRFDPANKCLIDVWLLPNPYPWTFVGLGEPDNGDPYRRSNKLILMAVSGRSGQRGLDLRVAVEKLRTQAEAYNALLIDEGDDVFQYANGSFRVQQYVDEKSGAPKEGRDRLRAAFILANREPRGKEQMLGRGGDSAFGLPPARIPSGIARRTARRR
jgi:hypothetical protein